MGQYYVGHVFFPPKNPAIFRLGVNTVITIYIHSKVSLKNHVFKEDLKDSILSQCLGYCGIEFHNVGALN